VLLAEDNPVNLAVVSKLLARFGCKVDAVEDGRQAVEAALSAPYDVIFLDWHMPVMDGLEAAREIRRREAGKTPTRLVALTASALAGDRDTCLAAGMDDYIAKPVTLDRLAQVLGRVSEKPAPVAEETGPGTARGKLDHLMELLPPASRRKIVDLFLGQAPVALASVRKALERGDAEAVSHEAHKLRGTCAQFAPDRVVDLAGLLEARADAGNLREAEPLFGEIEAELGRVVELFEEERKRL
jgi:CheY-like chemotaxis protein